MNPGTSLRARQLLQAPSLAWHSQWGPPTGRLSAQDGVEKILYLVLMHAIPLPLFPTEASARQTFCWSYSMFIMEPKGLAMP